MKEHLPSMSRHFRGVPGGLAMVFFGWLQTLLIGHVPSHTLLRIWDLLMAGRRGSLMQAAFHIHACITHLFA